MTDLCAMVKPLEFRENHIGDDCADIYQIMGRRLYKLTDLYKGKTYPSRKAAKAAAQADYTQRILAALDHAAFDRAVAEAVERCAQIAYDYMATNAAANPPHIAKDMLEDGEAIAAAIRKGDTP